jgi:hypothetical protein
MYPVSQECCAGMLGYSGRASTVEWDLYKEAFEDNALRFASHEKSYVIEGFG